MTPRLRYLRVRSWLKRHPWFWNAFLMLAGIVGAVGSFAARDSVGLLLNGFVVGYAVRALAFDWLYRSQRVLTAGWRRLAASHRRSAGRAHAVCAAAIELNTRLLERADSRRLH